MTRDSTGGPAPSPWSPTGAGRRKGRAAQCTAPTGWSGFPATGDRKGRPYGFTRACLNPRAGGSRTRPYGESGSGPFFRRGRTLAGPQMYAARPGGRALQRSTSRHLLGQARRGIEAAVVKIFANPGPGGPAEIQTLTQILRAGNFPHPNRYASLVMGVWGKATMGTLVPIGAVPSGVLVTLPPWAKSLAARRRRNPLRISSFLDSSL